MISCHKHRVVNTRLWLLQEYILSLYYKVGHFIIISFTRDRYPFRLESRVAFRSLDDSTLREYRACWFTNSEFWTTASDVSVSDSGCLRLIAESGRLKLFPVPPVSKSFKSSKSNYCANVARKVSLYLFYLFFMNFCSFSMKL